MSRPLLRRGSTGDAVSEVQRLLHLEPDGKYGPETEAAVRTFQRVHALAADGNVGPSTWAALLPEEPAPEPPGYVVRACAIARNHGVSRYLWPGRGEAPIGYVMGVACSLAYATTRLSDRWPPVIDMAKMVSTNKYDALNAYQSRFATLGMQNNLAGEDTLRHLFVLVLGLGMRESSGQYTEGRDVTATNYSADTCEAGAWQTSYNIRGSIPGGLFEQLTAEDVPSFIEVYRQGVSKPISRDWGVGPGRDFQWRSKHAPDYAALVAALGLRHQCNHWGPINRRQAQVALAADDMLRKVQATLKEVDNA